MTLQFLALVQDIILVLGIIVFLLGSMICVIYKHYFALAVFLYAVCVSILALGGV